MSVLSSQFITVEGVKLHYLTGGTGQPILLLHGFPTSSFLYRNVAPYLVEHGQVIALDLPGFGQSDKPLEASYSFRYFGRILTQFVEALQLEQVGLVVHDLGGPIGLHWACQQPERIAKLALLNTLVYPEFSWAVIAFTLGLKMPLVKQWLASPSGLKAAMRLGMTHPDKLTPEVLEGVQVPFRTPQARQALLKAGAGLHPDGFRDIAKRLPSFQIPVRIIYGERDRVLPDVAATMQRVRRDLPHAQVTALPNCGHFLQEDSPDEVGQLLAAFFKEA
jgi:haloalkane dehalogenase